MGKHHGKRRHSAPLRVQPTPAAGAAPPRRSWERIGWGAASIAVIALVVTLVYRNWPAAADEPIAKSPSPKPATVDAEPDAPKKEPSDDFLSDFNAKDVAQQTEADKQALTDAELEKRYDALAELFDQIATLKVERRDIARTRRTQEVFDAAATSLDAELKKARNARPDAAIPRWLTGELLMMVGGEPEEFQPYLDFAVKHGLRRPRLLASIARAYLEANRFADAQKAAEAAVDHAGQNRFVWDTYNRIAFSNHRFEEQRDKLARAFPTDPPEWVRTTRSKARTMQQHWEEELKLREAEAKANDLPRVRLVIEHRRFGRDAEGKPLTTVESTGRENVVIELFENEAPLTVANFIDLVSRGFYDGTRFYLAVPVALAAGGDPLTRNSDTSEDGSGGPGYVIPDECKKPSARRHFRGSVGMVSTGAHTAGSQFFLSLAPLPGEDGKSTVLGRVIEGQQAVDRITRGKTTRNLRAPGRLIPGDLLVRAEVVRKRNHEYRAVKE